MRIPHLSCDAPCFLREDSLFCPSGNSAANRLCFGGCDRRHWPKIDDIACSFPVIREFYQRRVVRCRLPAQPPSRGFSGSPPSANSPEEARKCATEWLCTSRKRVETRSLIARVCDFSVIISPGHFWGSHSSITQIFEGVSHGSNLWELESRNQANHQPETRISAIAPEADLTRRRGDFSDPKRTWAFN